MGKTILVLLDACGFEASQEHAGILELLTEKKQCAKYRVQGELPSLSRPMYETVLTGLPAHQHGILSNVYVMPSQSKNLFQMARESGLITSAAAYHWISELYNGNAPFNIATQRFQLEGSNTIQYGIYYSEDDYPDTHLYADAEFLRTRYNPDFLLVHPMNIDFTGHQCGNDGRQYRLSIMRNMECLALCLGQWLRDGYQVVVTADHGMDNLGLHAGNTQKQREVPLYILSDHIQYGDFTEKSISQLNIAPLLCKLLGIKEAQGMLACEEEIIFR